MQVKQLKYLFIFCVCSNLYSQTDTLNQLDNDSLKQGYWKVFKEVNSKSTLVSEGRYSNNRKTGKWIEYYFNGNIKFISIYNNGKPEGQYTGYYENGKIMEIGTWKNNRPVGEHIFYSDNGQFLYIDNYNENGKRDGKQLQYYPNGKIQREFWFKNGMADSSKTFTKDGNIEEKVLDNYDDMRRKIYGNYYRYKITETNEKKYYSSLYNKTMQMDSIRIRDGQLILNGKQTLYNSKKQITKDGIFKDNEFIEGKAYIYDFEGKLTEIQLYKNGQYFGDY